MSRHYEQPLGLAPRPTVLRDSPTPRDYDMPYPVSVKAFDYLRVHLDDAIASYGPMPPYQARKKANDASYHMHQYLSQQRLWYTLVEEDQKSLFRYLLDVLEDLQLHHKPFYVPTIKELNAEFRFVSATYPFPDDCNDPIKRVLEGAEFHQLVIKTAARFPLTDTVLAWVAGRTIELSSYSMEEECQRHHLDKQDSMLYRACLYRQLKEVDRKIAEQTRAGSRLGRPLDPNQYAPLWSKQEPIWELETRAIESTLLINKMNKMNNRENHGNYDYYHKLIDNIHVRNRKIRSGTPVFLD
ncbi:hypothetical protein JCM11641_003555 [Rhodosporidiobolus odoratus]